MACAVDRNLLVGLLALQVGLIYRAQLVAAFQAWTREKTRPLAELLIGLRLPRWRAAVDRRREGRGSREVACRRHGGELRRDR
jgi:hypothetical protein